MVEEKRTAQEWMRKLGNQVPQRQLSKEEYAAMIKKQQMIKGLLSTGKNILGGISSRVGAGLGTVAKAIPPALGALEQRMVENYDEAVGHPAFGNAIRETLYGRQTVPNPYSIPNPYGYETGYSGALFEGPNGELLNASGEIIQMPPSYYHGAPPQESYGAGGGLGDKQVVFFFDARDDTVSEVLGEFDTIPEAQAEVDKLRKQGLPAFYGAKGFYGNKNRLKA